MRQSARQFSGNSARRLVLILLLALPGCAIDGTGPDIIALSGDTGRAAGEHGAGGQISGGYPVPVGPEAIVEPATLVGWGEPEVVVTARAPDHAYHLDTGDRLRIFVYGQPNLSRIYNVDPAGTITVPLIGSVKARGLTTVALEHAIRDQLGAKFVKDPQVTADVQQTRPFFILGEVKTAGQFPYVPGMTVEAAVAIAGGYTERASMREFRITRRTDSESVRFEVPADYSLEPGDTVFVHERFF